MSGLAAARAPVLQTGSERASGFGGGLGLIVGLAAFTALVLPVVFALRHASRRRDGLKSGVSTAAQWAVMAALIGAPFLALVGAGPAFTLLAR